MTGLHDDRAPRRSKRLERSRPDSSSAAAAATAAMPPPARRAQAPVPRRNRERERSAPVARVARPPSGEQDPEHDVPDTSNRRVPDTKHIPLREELKHDRPCSSRKKLKQHKPWDPPSCAREALEHYNSMNQGDEHELVEAVDADSFIWGGGWLHANFLARRKGASNCVDLVPKYFFAELKLDAFGLHCASCVKMDSVESKNLGGCGHCRGKIKHPATGGYLGAKVRCQSAAAAAIDLYPSLFELQLHEKQLELLGSEEKLDQELDGW